MSIEKLSSTKNKFSSTFHESFDFSRTLDVPFSSSGSTVNSEESGYDRFVITFWKLLVDAFSRCLTNS